MNKQRKERNSFCKYRGKKMLVARAKGAWWTGETGEGEWDVQTSGYGMNEPWE